MTRFTLLISLLLPLAVLGVACDKDDDDDGPKTSTTQSNSSNGNDSGPAGEEAWICYCDIECDGAFESVEDEICSDEEDVEVVVDIAVDICATGLESECVEYDCFCECESLGEACG